MALFERIYSVILERKLNMKLKFSKANAKLQRLKEVSELSCYFDNNRKVYSFDLISGHSCPFANDCFAKVVVDKNGTKSIIDGKYANVRCFSASQEVIYKNVYNSRMFNFNTLRNTENFAEIIQNNLPKDAGIVRIHVAGDFFNQKYFDAWLEVANLNSNILFYAYTKSIPYWVARINEIPNNFILTASYGGRKDDMISQYNLRSVKIVFSKYQARKLKLQIDHDDSHAALPSKKNKDFALLIHGIQKAKTKASKAIQRMKRLGIEFSYSSNKKKAA